MFETVLIQKPMKLLMPLMLAGWLFVLQPVQAQSEDKPSLGELSLKSWPNPFRPSLANQEGSPFLFDEWLKGTIRTVKGYEYSDVIMKFNLLHGRLLIKLDEDAEPRMMAPIRVKSFSVAAEDSTYTFHRHLVPVKEIKKPMDPFFIELAAGDYYLLAKPGKQAQREDRNVLAQIDEQNNVKYVDFVDYFVENPSGKIIPFKNSKKVKGEIFGEDLSVLEKYAKQNKLRWTKPRHLAKIVNQANQ
ncbi:MAG: hypothetical protein R8G66_25035 [Cytophagales bacterium]|nr:hypothetical protein [Cytophagales bacterium]